MPIMIEAGEEYRAKEDGFLYTDRELKQAQIDLLKSLQREYLETDGVFMTEIMDRGIERLEQSMEEQDGN